MDTVSSLLHNRWNVFAGTEKFVVWEIMPGELDDNSVVDVWRYGAPVSWEVPIGDANVRTGRWRSFPMASLANASSDELQEIYGMLCREWNRNGVNRKRLVRFKAFMLQAPIASPSKVSKRLLHTQWCTEVVAE